MAGKKYTWKRAQCPSCGKTVWFSAPQSVAAFVPQGLEHLVPQTTMGECGHTVSVRFLDKPETFAKVNATMFARQQVSMGVTYA